jgi:predicted RNase H-like HicB family nuclease
MKKNTLQRGSVRFIIFKEKNEWYGTCLELNITESGSTPQEAMLLLVEAVEGYLESARKIKARPGILNQKTDPEYSDMWNALRERRKIPSKEIFSFGELNLSQHLFAAV